MGGCVVRRKSTKDVEGGNIRGCDDEACELPFRLVSCSKIITKDYNVNSSSSCTNARPQKVRTQTWIRRVAPPQTSSTTSSSLSARTVASVSASLITGGTLVSRPTLLFPLSPMILLTTLAKEGAVEENCTTKFFSLSCELSRQPRTRCTGPLL